MSTLASRLKACLVERGWTQFDLAKASSVSYRTIYNLMTGKTEPRPSILGRLAVALRVHPDYLTGKTESTIRYPEGGFPPMAVRCDKPPTDVREAITVLARQLHLPESRVAERVADLVRECVHQTKGMP